MPGLGQWVKRAFIKLTGPLEVPTEERGMKEKIGNGSEPCKDKGGRRGTVTLTVLVDRASCREMAQTPVPARLVYIVYDAPLAVLAKWEPPF